MTDNTPDYNNNLAFDPDALTMPRCDIEELKKKLNIATDALKHYADKNNWTSRHHDNKAQDFWRKNAYGYELATTALEKIRS